MRSDPWRLACALACMTLAALVGVAHSAPATDWQNVSRIVAFGDVHGDFDALLRLLRATAIVDTEGRWTGGSSHLVSLGDLLDRGPDSRRVMDLLMQLQRQAEAAGGRVHVVLGNHELMNLTGDLRYVAAEEWQAFAAQESPEMRAAEFNTYSAAQSLVPLDEQLATFERTYPHGFFAHRLAFSPHGTYGSWLLDQPPLIRLNRTLFVHGGLSQTLNGYQPDTLATAFEQRLRSILSYRDALLHSGLIQAGEDLLGIGSRLSPLDGPSDNNAINAHADFIESIKDPLFLDHGPLWYRGNSMCHPLLERHHLEQVLAALQADRVLVGHSPTATRRVTSRMDGLVIQADTGMLSRYYSGAGFALVAQDGQDQVVNEQGEISSVLVEPPQVNPAGLSDATLATWLTEGRLSETQAGLHLTTQAGEVNVSFTALSARKADKAVAAYLVDRRIGLGMVPVTMKRQVNGKTGVLTPMMQPWINHTELLKQDRTRPNWCLGGHAYELVTVFDALIGQLGRTTDNLLTDPRTWRLRLEDNSAAFTTSDRTGDYTSPPPLPEPLVAALESLTEEIVTGMLGDLLSKREIAAMLKRRDSILTTWPRA